MASLSAVTAHDKYKGSYEDMIRTLSMMIPATDRRALLAEIFKSIALSCVLGNGDAHLKNFGLLYADPTAQPRLAPIYDVCCTTAYISSDLLALTLGGAKQFPDHKTLVRFGRIACKMTGNEVAQALDDIAIGVELAALELPDYADRYPDFRRCVPAMHKAWCTGLRRTVGLGPGYQLPKAVEQVGETKRFV